MNVAQSWKKWVGPLSLLGVLVPMQVASEHPTCVPIPVEPQDCVARGEHVFPWDPGGLDCCGGLVPSLISEVDAATGSCVVMDGAMVCLPCGDGVCAEDEDECSCPEDCADDCVRAGGNVFPWDPSYGVCCPGLAAAGVMDYDPTTGECQPLLGGAVCIACGDGICGPGESLCNCPADCATDCDGLPEAACQARQDCEGGYAGFCDCTCPGPPGHEGGGCEGCGADCFLFIDCVAAPRALELTLDTSGGFTGAGGRDFRLDGGVLVIEDPFGDPGRCAVELRPPQRQRLLTAAGHVDWEALAATYVSPENPYCCCDQFVYDFRATIGFGTETIAVTTTWCDESRFLGLMPWEFGLFLDELGAIGEEIDAFCAGSIQ